MRIIITMNKGTNIKDFMNEICNVYHNVIKKYYRASDEIILANGDVIKGYSAASRRDGLRADVAIGVDAEIITCRSKIENPIWNTEKLHKHLSSLTVEKNIYR